jgi:erythronate-4-phosphate dehydrogenase
MKIVADDKIPFLKGVLEPFLDVEYFAGNAITPEIVKEADALIVRTRTKCNAQLLQGSNVRFIATATIGYDHIDVSYCEKSGIAWTNAAGSNSGSVMQYVAAALLAYATENKINLKEHVLGVIGAGNVGKKVIRLAEAIGMGVVINDPPRTRDEGPCGFVSLDGILREADIITVHVPLINTGEDRTFHLIDAEFMDKMNKGSLLINTARGEVVDNKVLKKALVAGSLSAAILDVWENEPLIDQELLRKVFIGTPHVAGYSVDGKANATTMVVNAVADFFKLDIQGWEPSDVPEPENKIIQFNAAGKSSQEILSDLIKRTYDIRRDDKALRLQPDDFEKYRGNYPFRREFGAYLIQIANLSEEDKISFERAGIRTV